MKATKQEINTKWCSVDNEIHLTVVNEKGASLKIIVQEFGVDNECHLGNQTLEGKATFNSEELT